MRRIVMVRINIIHLTIFIARWSVDYGHWFRAATAQGEIAHLAFYPSRITPITAGYRSLFQNLLQYTLMERGPLPWGE
jgi:hypothetical protein